MPNIFKRISNVLTANINDIIDRTEDPQRMIRQMIREMEANVAQAREGIIQASVEEKRLQEDLADHKRQSEEWLQRAHEAVRTGRRDLARTAIGRKKDHEHLIQTLQPTWEVAQRTSEHLKAQLAALQAKLREAKQQQTVFAARQRAAETQQNIDRTLEKLHSLSSSVSTSQVDNTFSQAVEKIKIMEAKARAVAEMNTDAMPEEEFRRIERERAINAELAEIERQVEGRLLPPQEQPLIPDLHGAAFEKPSQNNDAED